MGLISALRKISLRDQFSGQIEALLAHRPAPSSTNFSRR